jgi:hypothetical protein
MDRRPQLTLVAQPSEFNTSFAQMVERLVQWYPLAFGVLIPHNRKVPLLRMQTELCLTPSFCSDVYCDLARCCLLTPTETTQHWVRLRDVSLGELHERLWHEAATAQAAYNSTNWY